MSLKIVRDDLLRMQVDAIVNSTNEHLQPRGSGVDAALHMAAGPELERELMQIGYCAPGNAIVTGGGALPCRYVIHTVGPIWNGGNHGEEAQLRACYRNVLKRAAELHCESLAVPIISAGAYRYPQREALTIATEEIRAFLSEQETDLQVSIVVFNREMVQIADSLFERVEKYIGEHYPRRQRETLQSAQNSARRADFDGAFSPMAMPESSREKGRGGFAAVSMAAPKQATSKKSKFRLPDFSHIIPKDKILLDESFGEAVIRIRKEKEIKSSKLCLDANITKAVLSNIVQSVPGGSKEGYRPQKSTAIAVGIALGLNYEELNELLGKAGYTLTRSSLSDVIVEYFVKNGIYNVFEINEVLFAYDQTLLGSA